MKTKKSSAPKTLADRFLFEARDSHQTMSLYLLSGYQLKGEVVEVDSETILFKHRNVLQLVMRSAVGTLYPLASSGSEAHEWWEGYAPTEPVNAEENGSQTPE